MFVEVGIVMGLVRRGRVRAGTCSSKSLYCRDVFGEVVLETGRV